mmetsp:Transcript_11865/g.32055  ORF Transcript_11865/g.32055 Transcript_11865/m.32055 type:complete len:256 (-) Transcript_11865:467-1234(-)
MSCFWLSGLTRSLSFLPREAPYESSSPLELFFSSRLLSWASWLRIESFLKTRSSESTLSTSRTLSIEPPRTTSTTCPFVYSPVASERYHTTSPGWYTPAVASGEVPINPLDALECHAWSSALRIGSFAAGGLKPVPFAPGAFASASSRTRRGVCPCESTTSSDAPQLRSMLRIVSAFGPSDAAVRCKSVPLGTLASSRASSSSASSVASRSRSKALNCELTYARAAYNGENTTAKRQARISTIMLPSPSDPQSAT